MKDKTLASVVKESREKMGISQRELSRKTGIDNNTIAKIEKGLRKKPNILSLRKLSMTLNIEFEELLKLADYSKEDIETSTSNSYNIAVIPENAPIEFLGSMIKDIETEKYIKLILKELIEECDIDSLNVFSDLTSSEKATVKNRLDNFIKENNREIEKSIESIEYLNNLMKKNDE